MWSDNETREDLLGYQVHASLLKDVILDKEMLPTSIGIFGNWGAGKSSLMLLLQKEIDEWVQKTTIENEQKETLKVNNLILQIRFNSWKFENYESTKNTLIIEILEAIASDISNRKDAFEKADDLLKRISLLRVGMYVIKKGVQLVTASNSLPQEVSDLIPSIDELTDFLEPDEAKALVEELKVQNTVRFISKFRELFERIVIAAGYRAIVVYIDDLDRCNPPKVVDCLEAIKLFLNVANTAFVIGADERIVELAIQEKYHVVEDKKERFSPFSDYLEKLIQLPYKLPKLSFSEQETYITLLLCKWKEPNLFPKIHRQYLEFREKDKHTKYGLDIIRKGTQISRAVDDWLPIVPLMNHFLNGNPRQLKRFLNTIQLRMRMAHVAGFDDIKPDVLAKLMVFEYKPTTRSKFEELFGFQLQNNGYLPDIDVLEKNARDGKAINKWGQNWDTDEVRKWLVMSPSLIGVNLQDYFWISRESLEQGQAIENVVSRIVADLYHRFRSLRVLSLQQDIVKEVAKLSEDEIDMLVMLMNRDLRKDATDIRVWQIAQADTTGLIFGNVERMKQLFERVKTDEITAASKPALQRLCSLTESHKKVLSSLKLSDSLRNLLNKKEGK
jgi:predicted KAP-like P-loop ATPase